MLSRLALGSPSQPSQAGYSKMNFSQLNPKRFTLTAEQYANASLLHVLLQELEEAFIKAGGSPFVVSSGVRSMEDHQRIYREINAKRVAQELPPLKVPMGSRHLSGDAADLVDSQDQRLAKFCLDNLDLLERLGLYMEDPSRTKSPSAWVHLQRIPPASGNRVFMP